MTFDSVPELARRVLHLEMELKRNKPSHGTDNAALLKRISALESSVAMISKATPTKPQVYTPKPAATVPKPADKSLATKMATLEREVERLRMIKKQVFVPLTTPLTSTDWDGDAYSTTLKTKIDLSSVFSVPAGVRAVLVQLLARDSGSAASTTIFFGISPNNTDASNPVMAVGRGLPNDTMVYALGVVPCDTNGDIYYQIVASGSGTMDCWIRIWGYWL